MIYLLTQLFKWLGKKIVKATDEPTEREKKEFKELLNRVVATNRNTYFDLLNSDEQDRYLKNAFYERSVTGLIKYLDNPLHCAYDFSSFLQQSFTWEHSKEGYAYWAKVHYKYVYNSGKGFIEVPDKKRFRTNRNNYIVHKIYVKEHSNKHILNLFSNENK